MRLKLKERAVLRLLGVKISDDGMRWTASRKHEKVVRTAFERGHANAWRNGEVATFTEVADGLSLSGPKGVVTLRWSP